MNLRTMFARRKTGLVILALIGVMVCLVDFIFTPAESTEATQVSAIQVSASPHTLPVVEVTTVSAQTYSAEVIVRGQPLPRYHVEITAQVEGEISEIVNGITGQSVAKGDTLITIDNQAYLDAVSAAQLELAYAELNLAEERRAVKQAKQEWAHMQPGKQPDSPLVWRTPHFNVAQQRLARSESLLALARRNLANTEVKAPFSGVIINRYVAPGRYVQQGDPLVSIYSRDQFEMRVLLSEQQWQLLPAEQDLIQLRWPVELSPLNSPPQWSGYISRVENHIDVTTRQRALIITVDAPYEQTPVLLPGRFLEARISGLELPGLYKLPASALTRNGFVWYLDDDNRLQRIAATPVFQKQGDVYIRLPEQDHKRAWRILRHPLSHYLVNTQVQANEAQI
ncbi:MAG: efflux RND transporter periplasmic adaptor subunit [Pseudomonadales bacterium]|nr:efflux RND transporter periplasmic adaptor subunit [Pseudomonadales bacterium]